VTEATVAVLGVPYEATKVSRPGCRYGPQAIREATFMFAFLLHALDGAALIDPWSKQVTRPTARYELVDVGDLGLHPADVVRTTEIVSDSVEVVSKRGAFPVILGGDHYISYPSFRGFVRGQQQRSRDIKIGYVQVDAHLDLADEIPFWGKYSSGTQVRRMIEIPGVDPRRMVMIGIGGVQPKAEWDFAQQCGIEIVVRNALQEGTLRQVLNDAIHPVLSACDRIYVSLDIDVNDRTYAPGTGNAVAVGGLRPHEFIEILEILRKFPIGAVDLVEVAPPLDPTGRTAALAASALLTILSDRLFDVEPQ
jgi:agmatinase